MSRLLVPVVVCLLVAGCGSDENQRCGGDIFNECAVRATSDGGTPCRDGSECEGWCAAPVGAEPLEPDTPVEGTCSETTAAPCQDLVEDGRYAGTLCA